MPLRIYIGGKISGLPIAEVHKKFKAAEDRILNQRYEVVVFHGLMINACGHCSKDINGEWWNCDKCNNTGVRPNEWQEYLKNDLAVLMTCDEVHFLPDWRDSKGARLERYLAYKLKIPIYDITDNG